MPDTSKHKRSAFSNHWKTICHSFPMIGKKDAPLASARSTSATKKRGFIVPESLQDTLADIVHEQKFQTNMKKLVGDKFRNEDIKGDDYSRWQLRLDRITKERSTHWGFEATAMCQHLTIPLWGRLYKPIAHLKSWQRLIVPSYGRGTWQILNRMYDSGLDSPMPIYYATVKSGAWLPNSLLLTEHVGDILEVQTNLKNDSLHIDESGKLKLFHQLAQFANRLHAIGIYAFPLRYFHIAATHLHTDEHKFYLCDLDKALLWNPSACGLLHNLLRRKDVHRLTKQIHMYAGHKAADHFLIPIKEPYTR